MSQLISNLAVGAKIKYGNYKVETESLLPIIWKVADKNHVGYPANSVTLVTEKIIDLRGFDALETGNVDADRAIYGNNRYRTSNLRQWLNSSGLANAWWTAQNLTDFVLNTNNHDASPATGYFTYPTGYNTKQGFLNYFSADELSKILDTTLTVAKNTLTDGGASETGTGKIFLPSNTEVGLANENSIAEGSLLSLFATASNRISYLTQQAFTNTKSTSKPATVGAAWNWWLRTPNSSSSYAARYVYSDGSLHDIVAYSGDYGVRPALNLANNVMVSDTTDVDGCYTAIFWTAPNIKTNINGALKTYVDGWVNIGGVVRHITDMWTNVGGVLKKI